MSNKIDAESERDRAQTGHNSDQTTEKQPFDEVTLALKASGVRQHSPEALQQAFTQIGFVRIV
jgi:hypothetical protein